MVNIFDMLKFKSENENHIRKSKAVVGARDYLSSLKNGFEVINNFNSLLNAKPIEFDSKKHLKLESQPIEIIGNDKNLIILFSLDDGSPLCAYFDI